MSAILVIGLAAVAVVAYFVVRSLRAKTAAGIEVKPAPFTPPKVPTDGGSPPK
jgi:hypothetical protein